MAQLHDLTALEQGAAVRAGEVTALELVEHYAARIERLDGELGAFVTLTVDAAREQARRPLPAGPLAGVPTGIKDLNLTSGVPTGFGSRAMQGFVPAVDDHVVEKLRDAGLISLGKTATPEFGLPCYTETAVGPPTRNPWDLSLSAGGSSGGAGAAVAAGLLPVAQGSDGGGSLRIPGSVNGLVGLKVSRGRISRGPVNGDITGLAWDGPLGRTVRDAAAMLDVLAGPMPGDPHWAPPPEQSFLSACSRPPGRLRVGRTRTPVVEGAVVHPHVVEAYDAASGLLAELGHEVTDIDPPYGPELVPSFEVLWSVSAAGVPVAAEREGELLPLTRWLRERGRALSARQFTAAVAAVQSATRAGIRATSAYDVLLLPTLAQPPAPIGWFSAAGDGSDPAAEFARMKQWTPFTALFNATGQPAVSLPLHLSPAGLPIGVMLVGRPADEVTLLSLSAQLEAARPWADRHPPAWTS
ncbi:MAG TPA: amidase [Mycobacteriales bacterium]|jgi:amidase|nr:amidase [Mycobacteriales bacterium]